MSQHLPKNLLGRLREPGAGLWRGENAAVGPRDPSFPQWFLSQGGMRPPYPSIIHPIFPGTATACPRGFGAASWACGPLFGCCTQSCQRPEVTPLHSLSPHPTPAKYPGASPG